MQRYLTVVQQATKHHTEGNVKQAAFIYEHLLGAQPDDAVVLYLYGTLCLQLQQYGTAITMLEKSVRLGPELGEAWHNLGAAYRNEGHALNARLAYQEALKRNPDNADTLAMMAGTYVNMGEPGKAVEWAAKALEKEPENPQGRNHMALALLEMGQYGEAWRYYTTRYELPKLEKNKRPYEVPKWEGQRVTKLAIHGEQGIGDELMFLTCFHDLRDNFDLVAIECNPRLVRLLERSLEVPCYGTHEELIEAHPDVDAYIPMGDLPRFCRQTADDFPDGVYLRPAPEYVEEYRARLAKKGEGPYIGIAWHGGTKSTHQELRNPPMDLWHDLLKHGTCVSIQYGEHGEEGALELGIPHNQEAIDDLDRFAGLVSALDLVITPCQTAVHFAGALGKACWCLTPSAPAWRYGLKDPRMHWYESVKLYRQTGTWADLFDIVSNDLADFASLYRAKQAAA